MRKRNQKVISLMLIVVMLLNFLPATATAMASSTNAQMTPGVTAVPNPDYVEPGSVRELEARREENVKHFLLPDNTVQAVVYADAVHRMDDSGNWQDISNDLSLTEYKGVKFYTTADGRVVFAEKFAPNAQLWQLSENGYSIAMGMAQLQLSADATVTPIGGVTVTNAPVRRSATTWHSVEEARVVDNTASIVYANVKTNTDLEYIMVGNDIKENIVVKSRSNSYTYQFDLLLTGLAATQKGDGSISLTDSATGQQQYTIPAPYMVDAAGERSNAVSYSLKQTGEGQYTLTVTADSVWINAEDRAFPVKIDPTIAPNTTEDTFVYSEMPDGIFGGASEVWVKEDTVAYFKFDLPLLPLGSEIQIATLHMYYYYQDHVTTGNVQVKANMVVQDWSESTLTWNSAQQMNNYGIMDTWPVYQSLSGSIGAYEDSPGTIAFNLINFVNFWQNGTPNYGIALRYMDSTNDLAIIKSTEAEAQYRPFFTVTYTEPRIADGVYWIQNTASNMYLDVKNGGYAKGTIVQQNTQANATNQRSQLFKITFVRTYNNENYYSIRPMTNSGMGLSAPLTGSDRGVSLELMFPGELDNASLWDRMWIISDNGTHYTLKNGNGTQGGYLTAQGNTAGAQMITCDSITNNGKWQLVRYTGDTLQGVVFTNKVLELYTGETADFDAVVYSSVVGVNGPAVFSVSNLDNTATDKATIDPSSGELTALKDGKVIARVTFDGTQTRWGVTVTIERAYDFEVVHYYDGGMLARYDDARADIISYQEVCSGIFWQLFNLRVDYSLQQYTSCIDECKSGATGQNINVFCPLCEFCEDSESVEICEDCNGCKNCGHCEGDEKCIHCMYLDNCEICQTCGNCKKCRRCIYHRTGDSIREDALEEIEWGTPTLTRAVWTGHRLNNSEISNSLEMERMILVFIDTSAKENGENFPVEHVRQDRIFTLLHELSHQLGAKDHYCAGNASNGYDNPCGNVYCYKCYYNLPEPECVMDRVYDDLEERLISGDLSGIYCAECLGTGDNGIPNHLMDHHG